MNEPYIIYKSKRSRWCGFVIKLSIYTYNSLPRFVASCNSSNKPHTTMLIIIFIIIVMNNKYITIMMTTTMIVIPMKDVRTNIFSEAMWYNSFRGLSKHHYITLSEYEPIELHMISFNVDI